MDKTVIYQMNLRVFTKEGTLNAARMYLSDIASLGVDFVYLCPIVLSDDDTDPAFFSDRQIKSGFNNPKNPYRVKDYFKIDSEYGTERDFAEFVNETHRLGMKVMMDLVYFHCGPTSVFALSYPDFVRRNEDGSFDTGKWKFPKVNFDNSKTRELLYDNMEYFIKKFDVDGYRCDVGGLCPDDFWKEGIRRVRLLKPDFVMVNEGLSRHMVNEIGFDLNYDFFNDCFKRDLHDFIDGKFGAEEAAAHYKEKRTTWADRVNV